MHSSLSKHVGLCRVCDMTIFIPPRSALNLCCVYIMFFFFTYLDRYWKIRGASRCYSLVFVLGRSACRVIVYKILRHKIRPNTIQKCYITEAVNIIQYYYLDACLPARPNNFVLLYFWRIEPLCAYSVYSALKLSAITSELTHLTLNPYPTNVENRVSS